MAKGMNEMLRNLKAEKELEALPEEEDIKVEPDKVEAGSDVTIAEEEVVKPEDADAKRPKPLPKKNRRGSKALLAEIEEAHALAEANKEKYTRLLADFDNMRSRNEKENANISGEVDLYYQPVEDSDNDDDLKNLAENPRGLTEDFKEETITDNQ